MISIGVLRGLLKLPSTPPNPDRDARLAFLIEGATATIGRELGIYLGPPEQTSQLVEAGGLVILSDEPQPAQGQTAAAVKVEHRISPTAAWVETEATRYALEGRSVRLYDGYWHHHVDRSLRSGHFNRPAWIRVTYTRGYAVDKGPAELRMLVADVAAAKWRSGGREGLQSETIGDYSYTVKDLASAGDWPGICARWRRQLV